MGGHAPPPRDRPSGGARGGARACKNTKGLQFIKKNARDSPYTHKNIMNAHVECRGSRPCSHLGGENKNTTARQTMRRRRDNWAQLGGNKWRIDDKISATTSSTYIKTIQHETSEGDNVGGHAPPRETVQAWHGEVRARAKIQRVGGSLKKKCKGFPLPMIK